MLKRPLLSALIVVSLLGCSTSPAPNQKAQQAKMKPEKALNMTSLCKQEAAHRYNTGPQKIDVTDIEQYRGSVELHGFTARNESFVCSFDADGAFLHLSMR